VTPRDDARWDLDELKNAEAERRRMIDNLPVLSWRGLPRRLKDFFNLRWHDYTGLSPCGRLTVRVGTSQFTPTTCNR